MDLKFAEFCPRCGTPLDTSGDDSRLCESCGWYGDRCETHPKPPVSDGRNPTLAVLQALAMYRDVCRNELIVEQGCNMGQTTEVTLRKAQGLARQCRHWLVKLFTGVRCDCGLQPRVLKHDGGLVPWPSDWTDRHYNACNEPCDMLAGPCACGAWHFPTEDWVLATLARHNAVIE